LTDAQLLIEARERNPEAWTALYERYLPLVWSYAYALVRDVHLAEDIVSEAMLAFLKGIHTLDEDAPKISAWLRAVVRHKIADHHRRTYRLQERLVQLEADGREATFGLGPAQTLEREETRCQVLEILDNLPERQRLALEWKYVEGLRVREIAERLGETEKAVEASLYRARREFRRRFQLVEPATLNERGTGTICSEDSANRASPREEIRDDRPTSS
jgi:RNA polymerase sigma-70 factor (ECF subfamily)